MSIYTATYSPEDNKLRLYSVARLPADVYERVRAAGFKWAPAQKLFVAPAWSPGREDFLIELCKEIGDEDTSLVDRAEERADRFGDYSEARRDDAERAHSAVEELANGIPLGQPILVGHHSERRARKDAEKIENGMRRAVKMWETSEYWTRRAAGAIHHAKYKELPAVRHRRIKGLEADKRREERTKSRAETAMKLWGADGLTLDRAKTIANHDHVSKCFTLNEYPRQLPASQYEGSMGIWSALNDGIIGEQQAREICQRVHARTIAGAERWLSHLENRLAYERAMLGESGGIVAAQHDIRPGGRVLVRSEWVTVLRVNRKGGEVTSVRTNARYCSLVSIERIKGYEAPTDETADAVRSRMKLPPLCNYPGEGFLHQTQAEYDATVPKWSDFQKITTIGATAQHARHRVRCNRKPGGSGFSAMMRGVPVYITDAKHKDPPAARAADPTAPTVPAPTTDLDSMPPRRRAVDDEAPNKFEAMGETLRAGVAVQVISAPQLFPTPPDLARRVVDLADVQPGQRVLEPSAGTGNLVRAILGRFTGADCGRIVAVELNYQLAEALRTERDRTLHANESNFDVRCSDFLECNGDLGTFHRIVMNPPFANAADIQHIRHAQKFLKPGGRLVALCAAGPRQREAFETSATEWIDLEPGAFAASGTNVNAAIVIIDADEVPEPAEPSPASLQLRAPERQSSLF